MKRQSGMLMHISSLYGDYSIGSFGSEAKYFIDFLEDCGFSYWQTLPFGVPDEEKPGRMLEDLQYSKIHNEEF